MKILLSKILGIIIVFCLATPAYTLKLFDNTNFEQLTYYSNSNKKRFVFNPRTHQWYAYNSWGRLIRSGVASGGAGYCRDVRRSCRTPTGTFRINSKRGRWCQSSKYPLGRGGAKMPYCMFFRGGYAIHGSHDVPRNRHVSHGCIRVKYHDALWLHRNFLSIGTKVIVKPY